jgi:hypothetical protein
MIERSHRHKAPKSQPDPAVLLRLHECLAAQRLWFLRLLIGSSLALVVSLILWLVRVPLVWHLTGIALAFLAGLFSQRSMTAWALAWIRERAGLSYETALEHQKDEFGFSASVKQRAADEASRLELPKYQAWWLPMLAVALGLAFLPLIPSITVPTALSTQPAQTTSPEASNRPANTVEPSAPQATPQPVAEPPQEAQAPSQDAGETDTSQLEGASGSSASNNQSADEQALDQFLDNLRQNEQPQEQAPDVDLSSVMQPGNSNGQPSDEDRASRPRSEQVNPFEQAGQNQPNQAQQGQQQAPEDAAQNADESEQGQNAQSQQAQSQTDEGQSETAQSEEQQNAEGTSPQEQAQQDAAQQEQAQQGEGQQTQGEQEGEQEGAGESGMNAEGQQEGSSDSGQNAEGAGSLPGTPSGQSEEVVGSSQQNPDFLPGQLSEGPNNVAGTARLPGETEETVFPEGNTPGSFSRAQEEALTEGRIPLEYQEVIRNYFGNE